MSYSPFIQRLTLEIFLFQHFVDLDQAKVELLVG